MYNIPDLLKDATNVYRTKNYIVKQDLYMDICIVKIHFISEIKS